MMEASALIDTDFTKARNAAQRAIDKASAQGSHVLVARTYGILCQQGPSIEASADTIRECQIALQSSMAAGDMNGEAMMLTDLAGIYYQQGRPGPSRKNVAPGDPGVSPSRQPGWGGHVL